MAFDGIVVAGIVAQLEEEIVNGRIDKIYQPTPDEIILSVRSKGNNIRLLMTASASFPRLHLTTSSKENPLNPPMFCMSARKHLSGGQIINITQPHFERIVEIEIASIGELGDRTVKRLIIEIMGKHSNIILVSDHGIILDCLKKITHEKSSVREVLPGRSYIYPPSQHKIDPQTLIKTQFTRLWQEKTTMKLADFLYQNYTGISPQTANEICYRAAIDGNSYIELLSGKQCATVFEVFYRIMESIEKKAFYPCILYDNGVPLDFSSIEITQYGNRQVRHYDSISQMLSHYYSEKDSHHHMQQKTQSLRKLLHNHLERCVKKQEIQRKTLSDTQKMSEWQLCGELLTSYISNIQPGSQYYDAFNYYNETIRRIPLDPLLSAAQNAQKYYQKYNKAKRTVVALGEQMHQNETEMTYLNNLLSQLDNPLDIADIHEIRMELADQGYVKKRSGKKLDKLKKSSPLHYISSDGYDIFVGKNNTQNDLLTLKTAQNNDIWLHTKEIPGSHVIIKTAGNTNLPDTTLNEAALLAAYHSKGRNSSQVPVDYTAKKNVKKPAGSKPGMVVYDHYQTAYITPAASDVEKIKRIKN